MSDQTTATGRTPNLRLPWSLEVGDGSAYLRDSIGYDVSDSPIPLHLARFVALACNSHDTLLAALKDVERRMILRTDREDNLPSDLREILAIVRGALKAAKGGPS